MLPLQLLVVVPLSLHLPVLFILHCYSCRCCLCCMCCNINGTIAADACIILLLLQLQVLLLLLPMMPLQLLQVIAAAAEAISIKSVTHTLKASHLDRQERWSCLAKAGSKHPQDTEKQFHIRAANDLGISLTPYPYKCPIRRNCNTTLATLHMILPHELFSHLFSWDRSTFDTMFFGDPGEASEFWSRLELWSPEWWRVHPLRLQILSEPENWAPLRLFGDDLAVNKERNRNIFLKQFSSLLCRNETWFNQMLGFVLWRESLIERTTDYASLAVYTWSLNVLAGGVWPSTDHNGDPWKSGPRKDLAGTPLTPGTDMKRGIVLLYI